MAKFGDSDLLKCSFCGKSQKQVKKLIAGPGVYICDECIDLCNEIIEEELSETAELKLDELPKPIEIYAFLNDYVIGQDQAKKVLSVAVYNHYKRIQVGAQGDDVELAKSNIVLLGPTGCGKTLLAQTLARMLNVPFAIADATALTEAGYLGEIFKHVLPEDLLRYGLIPEFVGRLPVITFVHNLDRQALIDILTQPKNALIKQYKKFFEFDGVELEFADDALEAIADQCILRGTGARGLRAILEEVLLNVMYELPSRKDVTKCLIDEGVVLKGVNPTLVPRGEKEKAAKQPKERSA